MAKPLTIRWLRTALANLDTEAAYIARDDPAAAARTVGRIEEVVAHLADYPEMGRLGRVAGTRELVVSGTPYIVPYRVRGNTVQVLRVLHTARKWPPKL